MNIYIVFGLDGERIISVVRAANYSEAVDKLSVDWGDNLKLSKRSNGYYVVEDSNYSFQIKKMVNDVYS